jgi:PIN domain nuclease of toxin-antitoxin system
MIVGIADTHAIIWQIYSDPRLSQAAVNFINSAANNGDKIAVSSITLIEMVYLIEKSRIAAESFSRVAAAIEDGRSVFMLVPVDLQIARMLSRVEITQVPDMPDRIIAATALYLNLPIISRDAKIRLSSVPTIW